MEDWRPILKDRQLMVRLFAACFRRGTVARNPRTKLRKIKEPSYHLPSIYSPQFTHCDMSIFFDIIRRRRNVKMMRRIGMDSLTPI